MTSAPCILILTHHQLLDNPRVVREADALAEAGYRVRVVSVRKTPEISALDAALHHGKSWRLQQVNIERTGEGRTAWLRTGLRQKLFKALWARTHSPRFAGRAYCRAFDETVRLGCSEPIDLVIGHTEPVLEVVHRVARASGCPFAFDLEDILSEEIGEGIDDPNHRALVQYAERRFLPEAAYVSTAAPTFADWAVSHLGIDRPATVLNVFPRREAVGALVPGFPEARDHLSLHWWGATISPHRGLADAVRALSIAAVPCRLHIRGRALPGVVEEVLRLARSGGVGDRVFFHPIVPPQDLIREAAGHDVGLALMQPHCLNHRLAVPNKIFSYMSAGLALIATATEGHMSVLRGLDGPRTYPPGNPQALAAHLEELGKSPQLLAEARRRSLALARERFNWDVESKQLVSLVESVVGSGSRTR